MKWFKLTGPLAALVCSLGLLTVTPARAANCSTYPYTLTNGQVADATQVMANFNSILSCANANLAHSGANSDITALSALSTPLTAGQGGTGASTLTNLIATGYLQDNAVTNTKLATMATLTIKGNVTGGTAAPTDLTGAQAESIIQPSLPFEFYVFVGGLTANNWTLANYTPSTGLVLVTAKSACKVGTAATGTTTYTLKDNGSSIGTAVVTGGTTTCVATITSSPYTVTAGHVLSVAGPASADATLADLGMTFGGTRN